MSYSIPTLSGSIPAPATQPLQGVLDWTQSTGSVSVSAALLLHCDGANGSTSFPDSSGSGNVMTASGVTVSTSNPEFGTGSLFIAATDAANVGYLSCPVVADGPLDLNAGVDFTLEFSIRYNVGSSQGGDIMGDAPIPTPTAFAWDISSGAGALQFLQYYNDNSQLTVTSPTVGIFTQGVWYQCAVVRASGVYTFYINGLKAPKVACGSVTGAGHPTLEHSIWTRSAFPTRRSTPRITPRRWAHSRRPPTRCSYCS